MEVGLCYNHLIGFKPNLDRSLHDGHLCAAANCSSHLSDGVRHRWLCWGVFSAQASNACRVSTLCSCSSVVLTIPFANCLVKNTCK